MTCKLRKAISILFSAVVLTLAAAVITVSAAGVLLGDADLDGEVTVTDATCVQRTLADLPVSGNFSLTSADIDKSGELEVTDATFIQRWVAQIETPYPIGVMPTEAPTEAPTQAPTQAPTVMPTDEDGWGREIFKP